jgi:hypothetical protein
MPPTSKPDVLVIASSLQPYELLSGWRSTDRTLVLAVREKARRGQRVHARITLPDYGVATTITGRARTVGVRAGGSQLELEPDPARIRALEWLVEIASGARIAYQPRKPRYHASLPVVVHGLEGPTFMNTLTVSENGCGVAWTATMPDLDVPLDIRIGAGRGVASFCAEVRWTAPSARVPAVGLQFAAGDRATWAHILEDLKRSGAPPA